MSAGAEKQAGDGPRGRSGMAGAPTGLPFDDLRAIMAQAPDFDDAAAAVAMQRQADLAGMPGGFGRLADLMGWLAGWQGQARPRVSRLELCLFASAHGWLPARHIDAATARVKEAIMLLSSGGAAPAVLAGDMGAGLKVFDVALDQPCGDAMSAPALSDRETVAAMAFGMEAVAGQADVLCLSVIGAGTREVAAALCSALLGEDADHWLAGAHGALALDHAGAVEAAGAMAAAARQRKDPLERLAWIGGREIAAAAGAILAARTQRVPVVLDGFAALAACVPLAACDARLVNHCVVAGEDGSVAHAGLIARLGLASVLDLGMADGQGANALLAARLLQSGAAMHARTATRSQMRQLLEDAAGSA